MFAHTHGQTVCRCRTPTNSPPVARAALGTRAPGIPPRARKITTSACVGQNKWCGEIAVGNGAIGRTPFQQSPGVAVPFPRQAGRVWRHTEVLEDGRGSARNKNLQIEWAGNYQIGIQYDSYIMSGFSRHFQFGDLLDLPTRIPYPVTPAETFVEAGAKSGQPPAVTPHLVQGANPFGLHALRQHVCGALQLNAACCEGLKPMQILRLDHHDVRHISEPGLFEQRPFSASIWAWYP